MSSISRSQIIYNLEKQASRTFAFLFYCIIIKNKGVDKIQNNNYFLVKNMTNNKTLYIIIIVLVLVVIGGGLFFFLSNKGAQKETGSSQQTTALPSTAAQMSVADKTMVDCTGAADPSCFINRMNGCLPVTTKMTGTNSTTTIDITVLGIENDTCHFQRKINDVLNMDCYFPKGTLNADTLDQTFGNDKGLQKVVDAACKSVGW